MRRSALSTDTEKPGLREKEGVHSQHASQLRKEGPKARTALWHSVYNLENKWKIAVVETMVKRSTPIWKTEKRDGRDKRNDSHLEGGKADWNRK